MALIYNKIQVYFFQIIQSKVGLLFFQTNNLLMINIIQEMAEHDQPKVTSIKTYVRGAFLYSQDGFEYEEKHKQAPIDTVEKIVEDKIGITELKKEWAQKKQEIKRKKQSKNEKLVLIPIRDTPVQPVPEPVNDNQKCERALQDHFQYFQSYISQKEKQRKLDEQQQLRVQMFTFQQQMYKQKQEELTTPTRGIALVMEKDEAKPKKKTLMRIKIKKGGNCEEYQQMSKVRVIQ